MIEKTNFYENASTYLNQIPVNRDSNNSSKKTRKVEEVSSTNNEKKKNPDSN